MQAIIPAAGQGTRLYPQTHTKPKPMVRMAGKPILGHILDDLAESAVDEVTIVVGAMRDLVIEYVENNYASALDVQFVTQETAEGLGHAIYQARSVVDDDPLCIVLGDMLFESGYEGYLEAHRDLDGVDGSLGVKRVDDPSNYGVVHVDDSGEVTHLEEKPADPTTDLAISGIYVVEDTPLLFDCLDHLVTEDVRGAGDEYQLTDALQTMLDRGATFGAFDVHEWYDCGRPAALLEANRMLLDGASPDATADPATARVIPPVDIGADVDIVRSVVGPHVSIDDGARIVDSRVSDSIVGQGATLEHVNIAETLVGNESVVSAAPHRLNVGDSSEIQL